MSSDDWYKNWSESATGRRYFGDPEPVCECGLFKTYGKDTNLLHSDYCPLYIRKINKDCRCTPGGWHSVGCINRQGGKTEE